VIDLHLHTTASDGRSSPEALVREVAAAGIHTLAVADHDTVAALPAVAAAARGRGLRVVPGIEITAVEDGRDVHVLGYFFDPAHVELAEFLERQRTDRRRRLAEILARLDRLGMTIDAAPLLAKAKGRSRRAMGRPMVAEALVKAGHVGTMAEAFDRYLAEGQPAFVARTGVGAAEVVALVGRAAGLASLAHPGKLKRDAIIGALAGAGLAAIEVYHPDHDEAAIRRYRRMATRYDLLVTGGSDYHGPGSGRTSGLGRVSLPADDYARLEAWAARAAGR
jgi:hypothetical protein